MHALIAHIETRALNEGFAEKLTNILQTVGPPGEALLAQFAEAIAVCLDT